MLLTTPGWNNRFGGNLRATSRSFFESARSHPANSGNRASGRIHLARFASSLRFADGADAAMMATAEEWIEALELEPHPEGGFYRETYRSNEEIGPTALPDRLNGSRSFATSIYFLLRAGDISALHRIRQDEIWHFHDGDAVAVHQIDPQGRRTSSVLGRDPRSDQSPQIIVPAGNWFGAEVVEEGRFVLVGCAVAPGFEFEDLELADRSELTTLFPEHAELIARLTRSESSER
jgi:predicted cupin superfamily sugar epimerase